MVGNSRSGSSGNRQPIKARVAKAENAEEEVCPLALGDLAPNLPPFLRVRSRLPWWRAAGAPQEVLKYLAEGVGWDWPEPLLKNTPCLRSKGEEEQARRVLQEYAQVGCAKKVDITGTRFLVPWFTISNK